MTKVKETDIRETNIISFAMQLLMIKPKLSLKDAVKQVKESFKEIKSN